MISQTMLANIVHGATTGPYAGLMLPFYSQRFSADGNSLGDQTGIHSFAYFLSADFLGSIAMQASLVAEPNDNDWVTLDDTRITVTAPGVETATAKNYIGHAIWFRAAITDFTAGTIVKVQHTN